MTSPRQLEIAPQYKLRYSRSFVVVEIVFLIIILASIVHLLTGIWMALVVLLFVLMSIRFFRTDSIITSFPPGSRIEIRTAPDSLIWYDGSQDRRYISSEIKILMTRWFVLLQLGKGRSRQSKLLLADSFADINHYTHFRRQLIEMNSC